MPAGFRLSTLPILTTVAKVRGMKQPASSSARAPTLLSRLRPWLGPLLAVIVFAAALLLLRQELKHHSWREIMQAVASVPRERIALAIGLAALNYILLSGYDALAVRYLKHPLPYRRVLLGS